jgi:glutamate-1-semialdehyde aminotransferase
MRAHSSTTRHFGRTFRGISRAAPAHGFGDHDGREFLDLEMGIGPVLLGYDHPVVRRTLRRHARTPVVGTLIHPSEVEVAELLVEMVPSAELAVFGKNGADVCTAAARIARAATGRSIILSSGYRGMHDWYIADCWPGPGVLPSFAGYLKNFAFNDLDGLARLAEAHRGDIAAIMLDPANRETPRDDFLPGVRRIADAHGALLIFDEVLTGFRLHRGGGQALYGVTPDLTCLGKALANGLPLSALVGRSDLMHVVDRIFYGLTYQHDSVALAVSSACLRYYRDHDVAGEGGAQGGNHTGALQRRFRRRGIERPRRGTSRTVRSRLLAGRLRVDGRPAAGILSRLVGLRRAAGTGGVPLRAPHRGRSRAGATGLRPRL